MLKYPELFNFQEFANNCFSALRMKAFRARIWTKLFGKSNRLFTFAEKERGTFLNKTHIGIDEIPVENIIGTLGRENDFDNQFRPLKDNLRERWVNIYLLKNHWEPIIVHKINDEYFVEDGHHRLSVARAMNQAYIQADVWEHARSSENMEQNCCCTYCGD